LAIIVARPLALGIALFHSRLTRREFVAAAWFGPKGFASVVYGLLMISTGIPRAPYLFHLVVLVVVGSIIASSSTDVIVARWFQKGEANEARRSGENEQEQTE
jgi:NhaP-type Na+/H+ or K+/H+ antiporter